MLSSRHCLSILEVIGKGDYMPPTIIGLLFLMCCLVRGFLSKVIRMLFHRECHCGLFKSLVE
ncbi:hypothetical protein BDW72DRAFT_174799 [Aspergillus terricola var. indicus]